MRQLCICLPGRGSERAVSFNQKLKHTTGCTCIADALLFYKEYSMKDVVDLGGGYVLHQPEGVYPCGTDAVVLAYTAAVNGKGSRFADLCSGSGVVGILVSKRRKDTQAVCFEYFEKACDAAKASIEDNGLSDRMRVVCGDIKKIKELSSSGLFDFVTVNPPYMKANSGIRPANEMIAAAKQEILCNLDDVLSAASYLLKPDGQLFVIFRLERYEELMTALPAAGLNPVSVREVKTTADMEPKLVVVQAKKGTNVWLEIEKPLVLRKEDGTYTDETSKIYTE